ncbi:YkgJ family cysteine cluster protein [Thermodesulfobacteriota bacterium]
MSDIDTDNIFRSFEGNTFVFKCHKDISCFNKCCSKLKLILTPYDILRIKNQLDITSDIFLDKYSHSEIERGNRFPTVKLKMSDNPEKTCPFVTELGCRIYENRPGACRLYPLGRASAIVEGVKNAKEKFFIVKESHCLGFQEKKTWDINQWLEHEGLEEYYIINDMWQEIISSSKNLGKEALTKKIQMFFMVSYNLDVFRKFVFESRFFDRFVVEPKLKERMFADDKELLKFGLLWLKFVLFGEKTVKIKVQ